MFSSISRKVQAAEVGEEIFALICLSPNIPTITESLHSKFRSTCPIDIRRFANEYVFFRMFVADYALDSVAATDPKVNEVRAAYNSHITLMTKKPEVTGLHNDVHNRFERYAVVVNTDNHNGPAFAAATTFLKFCGDTNRAKDISLVIEATLEFQTIFQTVVECLKSRKIKLPANTELKQSVNPTLSLPTAAGAGTIDAVGDQLHRWEAEIDRKYRDAIRPSVSVQAPASPQCSPVTVYGTMWERLRAYVSDVAVIFLITGALVIVGFSETASFTGTCILISYMVLSQWIWHTTIGKYLFDLELRSTKQHLRYPSLWTVLSRETVGRFISSFFFFAGYWSVASHPQHQAWSDRLNETVVVKCTERARRWKRLLKVVVVVSLIFMVSVYVAYLYSVVSHL